MQWLIRLLVALSLVSTGAMGLMVGNASPLSLGAADLFFGTAIFAGFIIWTTREDFSGR